FCRNLRMEDGRCAIHGYHPFSCDFELLRFFHHEDPDRPERLGHQPFGHGWNMKRIDGERGALCEWHDDIPCDPEWIDDVARKLERLEVWCQYFDLTTTLPAIIKWVRRGPHQRPLTVGPEQWKGFFDG